MSIQNTVIKNVYQGNGVTRVFPYTFALKESDGAYVKVFISGENEAEKETNNFTIDTSARNITYPADGSETLPAGKSLTIIRSIPYTQELNLVNQGAFFAEDIETELDRIVMMVQQIKEETDRSVKAPISDEDADKFVQDIYQKYKETLAAAEAAATSESNAAESEEQAAEYASTIGGYVERVEQIEKDLDAASKYLGARATVYDPTKQYVPADVVMMPDGSVYRCLVSSLGDDPATSYKWQRISVCVNDTFELDSNGDLMPRIDAATSTNWEVDSNGDIQPMEGE